MPEVRKHEPPPPPPTYDLIGLTYVEMSTILHALRHCSAGHFERTANLAFESPSRFGQLFNTLSAKV